jgi:hypothetical protein
MKQPLPHYRDEQEWDKDRETEQAQKLHRELDRECAEAIARDGRRRE